MIFYKKVGIMNDHTLIPRTFLWEYLKPGDWHKNCVGETKFSKSTNSSICQNGRLFWFNVSKLGSMICCIYGKLVIESFVSYTYRGVYIYIYILCKHSHLRWIFVFYIFLIKKYHNYTVWLLQYWWNTWT